MKNLKNFSIPTQQLTAILFSIYGLYLRYQALAKRELWLDETNQVKATLGALQPFWQRLTYAERTCFPGEYLLNYPLVQLFPYNKWAMAIPHIISTLLGFYLFYLICRRYLKTVWGWAIAFALFSLNENLIFHAFEFRPYAVLPTLALASFYFAEMIVDRPLELSRWKKIGIGLLFVFTIFYHAYGILIVGLPMLFFLLQRMNKTPFLQIIKEVGPFAAGVAVFGLPIFLWYAAGTPDFNYANTSSVGMNTFDYIPNPLNSLNKFFRTVMSNLVGYKKLKFLINGIFLAALISNKDKTRQLGILFFLIVLPIELLLLADLHTGYWFLQRQFVWVIPWFALLVSWCWDSIVIFITEKLSSRKLN